MLIVLILDIKEIENYLKKKQLQLAIEEIKSLKTEYEFMKAYYLFLKYEQDEMVVIETARKTLRNENFMINEAFEYYYKNDNVEKAIYELSKSNDENYIYYQTLRLYSSFGTRIYRELDKYKFKENFRKAIYRFFLTDGKLEMALKYALSYQETLTIANSYYEEENYEKVIELLKNKRDNFSKRLYGLSLYKTGNYESASKILENIEPETAAICYVKTGNYEKALKLTKDTNIIIISLFELKRYNELIKFCKDNFYKYCFLSYLYTQTPESLINYFNRTFKKAKNIDSDIALYIEILNTYKKDDALGFFYIIKGEERSLNDKNLENLAHAIYYERKNNMKKSKEYLEKISESSWIRPFAIYKLYLITKNINYKQQIMENYPSSVYAEIIRDK
ncbi:MAG: hypothetical protein N2504_02325 [candidate division WOR-3 bacterium]|nr:hypothetical protein [candidate division WOR-3 bacterium]MCX7947410.1 hypothetical protein [candidate division WOR-3 bacterium]MDW8151192.1 hypothetical protein [candidate division WOR-3 bacterium]